MSNRIDGLSDRKKLILKAIVEAHIQGGEPVGSKYITESKQLTCSSATIRNEMAELENMGYLEQPHTSAGRIPSKQGYRFYVDTLLEEYAMTAKEIAQINQLMKIKMSELDRILDKASKVASSLTNYTGFAIKPRSRAVTVTRFETALIDSRSFILILVASDGSVKTRNILTDSAIDLHTVTGLSQALNELVAGLDAEEITLPIMMSLENRIGDSALANTVMKSIYEVLGELDGGELKVSGLDRLLQYPEFSDSSDLGELLGAFERKDEILDLVSDTESDRVNVVIGSESSVKVINNSTFVFKPIKSKGKTVGAIGVIGPLRMDYARVLATLDNLGGNISQLLNEPKHTEKGDNHDG
ncbi:MAG: heat-inducible transcription repressor HrcA [Clostridia bacterium]|nr:heat-inducible transcription repressor HrcA [Clostridia bacterium]